MTKVGVAIVAALAITGSAAAATQTGWTTRDARNAARALAYPKPHAKKITCRGATVFRCNAVYRHARRRFVLGPGTEGGWTCAGRTLHTCHVLTKGFLASRQVTAMGGLTAAAGYSATGYIQEHYKNVVPEQAGGCNPFGSSAYTCAYSTPAVTVTITYKHVTGGWLVKGST